MSNRTARHNLREYLARQKQETFRACIIYAPAMGKKTDLARRMRDILKVSLFDLQAYFLAHPDLASRIDRFRPLDLEHLLLELQVPEPIVVVDNIDFLLNTWTSKRRREFVGMVDLRLKSPGVTDKTFVFLVQDDPVIITSQLTSRSQPRILSLNDFQALM